MNKVELVGRLTKDVSINMSNGGTSIARFTIACDRRFKTEGQPTADFISCIAFGKTAEFIEKYFSKGMRIGVSGRIQTGSYDNNEGKKVYTTDVVIEEAEFVESKAQGDAHARANASHDDGFMDIPDGIDEELPFA